MANIKKILNFSKHGFFVFLAFGGITSVQSAGPDDLAVDFRSEIFLASLALKSQEKSAEIMSAYAQAKQALNDQDAEKAIDILTRITGKGEATRETYLLLADAYIEAGSGLAAEAATLRARDLGADFSVTVVPFAKSKLIQGFPAQALESLQGVPLDGKDRIAGLIIMADSHFTLKENDKAETLYQEASRAAPQDFQPFLGLARIAMQKGKFVEAQDWAIKAKNQAPESTMVHYTLGLINKYQGNPQGGRPNFQRAVDLFKANLFARLEIANLDINAGDLEAAERQLDVIFTKAPGNRQALYLSALIAAQRGNFKEAHRLFNRISPLIQNYLPGLYMRGIVAFETGSYEVAVDSLQRVLKSRPANRLSRLVLATSFLRLDRPDLASPVLAPMLASGQSDAETLTLASATAAALGNTAQSALYLQQAQKLADLNGEDVTDLAPDFKLLLALAQFSAGDSRTAIDILAATDPEENRAVDIDRLGLLASMQHSAGDLAGSEATTEKMIATAPERALGYNILGTIRFSEKRYRAAYDYFTLALSKRQNYLAARRNRALSAWQLGKLSDAEQDIRKILTLFPNDTRSKALLGRLLLDQDRAKEALVPLSEAFRALPQSRDLAVDLAIAQGRAGNTTQAIRDVRLALKMVGSRPDLLKRIGTELLNMGEPVLASGPLQRYQAYQPESVEASILYGRALFGAGLYSGADRSFKRAYGQANDQQKAMIDWYIFANNVYRGDFDQALKWLDRLDILLKPDDIPPTIIGEAYVGTGNNSQAIKYFETSYAAVQNGPIARALARAYWQLESKEKALDLLERETVRQPNDRRSLSLLGDYRFEIRDYDKAALAYENALSQSGSDFRLLSKLSLTYLELGKSEALDLAERAYLILPENPAVLDTYGWVLLQAKRDISNAIRFLERAVLRDPDKALYRYHLGMAYLAGNKRAEARNLLQEALNLDNQFKQADEAREQLRRLQ